jgi:deazaflavin-dependent oxidoreductase (nitroreductase family)
MVSPLTAEKASTMTTKAYLRQPWAARAIGGRMARLFRPSIVRLLSVHGRTTGQWRSVPVVVLEHDGDRYLIAAYGNTEWSRNLRAAGIGRLSGHGRVEEFTTTEVRAEQRPPLISAYLRQFGTLPTVASTFRALPDPADHPTFRIISGDTPGDGAAK